MMPEDIDRILERAAEGALPEDGDGAAARAAAAMVKDLRPVRPLAPWRVFAAGLLALAAAFAAVSAAGLGMGGLRALDAAQRVTIYSLLLIIAGLAATACARQMRPAAGRNLGSMALALAAVAFPAVFALLFHGYGAQGLVAEGIPCLIAGLSVAIPAGLATALVLRRGYVMNRTAAGVAAGALAGLAGLGMLELHCPNLKAIHVIVWHVGVVVVSGALGFCAGRMADAGRRRSSVPRSGRAPVDV